MAKDTRLSAEQAYNKAITIANKNLEKQRNTIDSISNAIFGISGKDWLKAEKSTKELNSIKQSIVEMSDLIKDAASSLDAGFSESIGNLSKRNVQALTKLAGGIKGVNSKMTSDMKKAIKDGNISEFLQEWGVEGEKQFLKITKGKGFKDLHDFVKNGQKEFKEYTKIAEGLNKQLEEGSKQVFSISTAFGKIMKNFSQNISPQRIVDTMGKFDQSLSNIQRQFNVVGKSVDQTSKAMSELAFKGAQFGVSMEDSFKSVEQLANVLRTDNLPAVAETVSQLQSIPGAIGASREDVMSIAGSMQFMGSSTEKVKDTFKEIAKQTAIFGLNTSKVTADIAKNLPKWQQLSFKGGEASLVKLAIMSEKLGVSLGTLLDSAGKFRLNLEGSVESAAQLQLIGGSFANTNPFELMAASEDPAKFGDMVKKMTSDIGEFNKKTGEFTTSTVDMKRMQMAAEALGVSYEELRNMAAQSKMEAAKIEMFPGGLFEGLKEDEKAFLLKSTDLKNKTVTIKGDNVDISKLTQAQIKEATNVAKEEASNLEKRNIQNQSLKESFDSLVNSFLNVFTVFEPVLKWMGGILNSVTTMLQGIGQGASAALAVVIGGMALLFGYAKQFASGFAFGKGFNSATKGTDGIMGSLKFWKKGGGGETKIPTEDNGEQGKMSKMLETLKSIKPAQLLSLAAAMVAVGIAFVGIGYGVKLASEGLSVLIGTFKGMTGGEMIAGLVALTLVGFGVVAIIGALGAVSAVAAIPILAVGAAFLMVGAGIAVASLGLAKLVESFSTLSNISGEHLMGLAVGLSALGVSIAAFGAGSIIGGIGSLLGLGVLSQLENVAKIAPQIDIAAKAINSMADGVERLKSSIKGLDVSTLKEISEMSGKLSAASANLVSAAPAQSTSTKPQKIEIEPITIKIELGDSHARMLWEKQIKANAVAQ